MDVLTLFVDQGALAGIRVGGEGIIVDAHLPEGENVTPEEIQQSLSLYFRGVDVRGLILTGFDSFDLSTCVDHVPKVLQGYGLCHCGLQLHQ